MVQIKEKFSSKMDKALLKELRSVAKIKKQNISDIFDEAISEYLNKVNIKPVFQKYLDDSINENEELLKRLAK